MQLQRYSHSHWAIIINENPIISRVTTTQEITKTNFFHFTTMMLTFRDWSSIPKSGAWVEPELAFPLQSIYLEPFSLHALISYYIRTLPHTDTERGSLSSSYVKGGIKSVLKQWAALEAKEIGYPLETQRKSYHKQIAVKWLSPSKAEGCSRPRELSSYGMDDWIPTLAQLPISCIDLVKEIILAELLFLFYKMDIRLTL